MEKYREAMVSVLSFEIPHKFTAQTTQIPKFSLNRQCLLDIHNRRSSSHNRKFTTKFTTKFKAIHSVINLLESMFLGEKVFTETINELKNKVEE